MAVDTGSFDGNDSETCEEALKPGDLLLRGQYRIERYLSAGGFGITYLACDSLDRKVVIKECFPNSMCWRSENVVRPRSRSMQKDFETVVRHFGLEARRMSKLSHPNIVGVHQVFEDNGTAYMALDFIEGRELLDVIENDRATFSASDIKEMLLQLLDAIAYIHDRDVLHRDISPDNILIDRAGNPVLIDFGAAREVAASSSRMLSSLHIVKDGYSPQEFYIANDNQCQSSDLYSLAATFYHLITGAAPPNSQIRLAALAGDTADPYIPVPPRTEGYDRFFLGALDKALTVFPKNRLQSAVAWIEEIDQDRRQKAMVVSASQDRDIELTIREMTQECNRELKAAGRKEPHRAHPKAAQAVAIRRAPVAASRDMARAAMALADDDLAALPGAETNEPNPLTDDRPSTRRTSLLVRILSFPVMLFRTPKRHYRQQEGSTPQ